MIKRALEANIRNLLGGGKAITIMGARQVGKSTLLHQMLGARDDILWLSGDEPDVREMFDGITSTRLRAIIGSKKIMVIDEAQRIENIGLYIKLITDNIPGVQVIATGSSSFELSSKLNESLAGRKREYKMLPLSFGEMCEHTSFLEEHRMIAHRMTYGYYPEVVTHPGEEREILKELTDSYLYKDILSLNGVSKPDKLVKLVRALALQIGGQVSYNEVGNLVGLDSKTVEKYVDILEKSYIIFRLPSYSRNQRNELKTTRKIYFWDLGIRNAVVGNMQMPESRLDVGELWENFVIVERMKRNAYASSMAQIGFWRNRRQNEVDYIEEEDGELRAYEMKWNEKKSNVPCPKAFIESYPKAVYKTITPGNIEEFVL